MFRHLIPSQPGWRVVEFWDREEIAYSVVVAWAETDDHPGELLPVVDTGEGFQPVERDDFWVDVLEPGQDTTPEMVERWARRADKANTGSEATG